MNRGVIIKFGSDEQFIGTVGEVLDTEDEAPSRTVMEMIRWAIDDMLEGEDDYSSCAIVIEIRR